MCVTARQHSYMALSAWCSTRHHVSDTRHPAVITQVVDSTPPLMPGGRCRGNTHSHRTAQHAHESDLHATVYTGHKQP
jgi:hypothetical protein